MVSMMLRGRPLLLRSRTTCQAAAPPVFTKSRSALLREVAALIGGCACCPPIAKANAWSYGALSGPSSWPGVCTTGSLQSPVSVPMASPTSSSAAAAPASGSLAPQFDYATFEAVNVLNTGHGTMQVNFPPGSTCTVGGRQLRLLQYHFHAPSEHSLGGTRYAMEAHLVHQDVLTGGLCVLGVLLQRGGSVPNPALDLALRSAPRQPEETAPGVSLASPADLLPRRGRDVGGSLHYVHYTGSLTTPPCSEGVDWCVFTTPVKVTDAQVLDFMQYVGGGASYGMNARALQANNERSMEQL